MEKYKLVLVSLTILFLQACGSTVLVKQEATDSITIGRNAISEINNFHDYIFYKQDQLAASLIARYPSCDFGESIVIRTNFENVGQYKKTESLCLSNEELRKWQSDPSLGKKLELVPFERSTLKSSMDILDAFAKYLDAISTYTAEPSTPIANTLMGVTNELSAAQQEVDYLPDAVGSRLEETAAVNEFIGYLEKLIKNSNDAKKIAEIVGSEGEKQERYLEKVAEEADNIFTTYIATMSDTLSTTLGDYYNKNKSSKEFENLEKRQQFILELFKQKQLNEQIRTSSSPGAKAIRLFSTAHQKLRDSITGNYSKEQKAFIQQENMKELREGLQHIANLVRFVMATL